MADQWSYYPWVVKVPTVFDLGTTMNAFGAEGWELVTSVTTVKSWINLTGNDLVFVFKRPGTDASLSKALVMLVNGGVDPDTAY